MRQIVISTIFFISASVKNGSIQASSYPARPVWRIDGELIVLARRLWYFIERYAPYGEGCVSITASALRKHRARHEQLDSASKTELA